MKTSPGTFRVWAVVLFLCWVAPAQPKPPEPARSPVTVVSPVQDKNFYLLSMLERTPAARDAVRADAALARIAAARMLALEKAAQSCSLDLDCYAAVFEWSDAQSQEAAAALTNLYRTSPAIRALLDGPLRESGLYVRYQTLGGERLLERAWSDCARGLNRTIEVYGLGKAPRYPAIDSVTYDVKSEAYRRVVEHLAALLEDDRGSLPLFFSPSLRFALELLWLNNRDEAGRYEPMETGENAAAFRHIQAVDWNRYPYSVIVVPGAGNDIAGVRLSPEGKLRNEIAARRFRESKAPFVLVSGGFVHPAQTEFAEAIEMKRDLVARFGIPADAILIDPHARHTTTNIRNAARLIYRYGIPFDKRALISTDPHQIRGNEKGAV
jgi:hypothetical protein